MSQDISVKIYKLTCWMECCTYIISLIKWLGQDAYLLRFQVSESVGCENLICILKCPDSNTDMYSFTIDINLLIWSLTQFIQYTYVVGYNIN